MKMIFYKCKTAVVTLLCAAASAGLTACEADPVETLRGKQPDKETLESTSIKLFSETMPGPFGFIRLEEGTGTESVPPLKSVTD